MEPLPTTPAPPAAIPESGRSIARIVYVLYLVSLVVGVTALIGLVMAYVHAGDASPALVTHYRVQIRTFWIGLLYCVVGGLLAVVGIGFVVFVFVAVWLIIRCVKGLRELERGEPYANATTWLW